MKDTSWPFRAMIFFSSSSIKLHSSIPQFKAQNRTWCTQAGTHVTFWSVALPLWHQQFFKWESRKQCCHLLLLLLVLFIPNLRPPLLPRYCTVPGQKCAGSVFVKSFIPKCAHSKSVFFQKRIVPKNTVYPLYSKTAFMRVFFVLNL